MAAVPYFGTDKKLLVFLWFSILQGATPLIRATRYEVRILGCFLLPSQVCMSNFIILNINHRLKNIFCVNNLQIGLFDGKELGFS